jgi:hypothetical protein
VTSTVGKTDEIHNLRTNHQAGSEAASALKVFSERLDATFLYAGIDLLQSDLLSGHMGCQIKGRMHRSSSKLGLHGVAAVSEHVTMKTEPPNSDLGLMTRFERNAIPLIEGLYGGARRLTRNLAGAEDLVQDTIGECRAQQAKVNR